jgi:hypothetical protein
LCQRNRCARHAGKGGNCGRWSNLRGARLPYHVLHAHHSEHKNQVLDLSQRRSEKPSPWLSWQSVGLINRPHPPGNPKVASSSLAGDIRCAARKSGSIISLAFRRVAPCRTTANSCVLHAAQDFNAALSRASEVTNPPCPRLARITSSRKDAARFPRHALPATRNRPARSRRAPHLCRTLLYSARASTSAMMQVRLPRSRATHGHSAGGEHTTVFKCRSRLRTEFWRTC